jgi:hypothetical protein
VNTDKICIDECITWILSIIDSKKIEFKYASGEGWEFLIFLTEDYYIDTKMLTKIERITGMILVQIRSKDCKNDLWFGRRI